MKKSQASLFIVIGIILIGLIIFGVYLYPQKQPSSGMINPADIESVKAYEQKCLEQASTQALFYFGQQGGYLRPALVTEYLQIGNYYIPYYLYNGNPYLPSRSYFEQVQLADYINNQFDDCLNQNVYLDSMITKIEKTNTSVTINDDSVVIKLPLVVYVSTDTQTVTIDKTFDYISNIRLGRMIDYSHLIVNKNIRLGDQGMIDVSYFNNITGDDFGLLIYPMVPGNYLIKLNDLSNDNYTFQFAAGWK